MGWDQAETGMEGDSGELFAASKGAIMAFSRSLALSLAPAVRVNCLAPGWIRTAWGEGASRALAGARAARDAVATLGSPRRCCRRGALAGVAGGRVSHRADHSHQRRRGALTEVSDAS